VGESRNRRPPNQDEVSRKKAQMTQRKQVTEKFTLKKRSPQRNPCPFRSFLRHFRVEPAVARRLPHRPGLARLTHPVLR